MKYQLKAFQMSFALHAFVLSLFVIMNNALPHSGNLMVVDFSIEDAADREIYIDRQERPVNPAVYKQRNVNPGGMEIAQQKPDNATFNPVPSPAAPEAVQLRAAADIRETSPDWNNIVSENGRNDKKNGANQNTFSESSDTTAFLKNSAEKNIDMINGKGETTENMHRAGVPGYLKANFSYIKDIINRHIVYPRIARQMGWTGKVKISFVITVNGDARNVQVIESSGREILDSNAAEAIRKASPFPRPPVEAKIIMPVHYTLH